MFEIPETTSKTPFLQETLGDSKMRSKWRTKQNIDFSYLMIYAQARGRYYCQMEDDVIAKPGKEDQVLFKLSPKVLNLYWYIDIVPLRPSSVCLFVSVALLFCFIHSHPFFSWPCPFHPRPGCLPNPPQTPHFICLVIV